MRMYVGGLLYLAAPPPCHVYRAPCAPNWLLHMTRACISPYQLLISVFISSYACILLGYDTASMQLTV